MASDILVEMPGVVLASLLSRFSFSDFSQVACLSIVQSWCFTLVYSLEVDEEAESMEEEVLKIKQILIKIQ